MSTATVSLAIADSRTAAIGPMNGILPHRPYPFEIPIFGRIRPNCHLVKPIMLTIERDEDMSYVVSDDVFYLHGAGATIKEALRDYLQVIVEFYELLSRDTDEPSVALFDYLKTYLYRS